VELSAEAIIEEFIDPLIMGGLAESFPNIELQRSAPNVIEIDFRVPEGVCTITVEPRSRTGSRRCRLSGLLHPHSVTQNDHSRAEAERHVKAPDGARFGCVTNTEGGDM
jgi:hypothetical protein